MVVDIWTAGIDSERRVRIFVHLEVETRFPNSPQISRFLPLSVLKAAVVPVESFDVLLENRPGVYAQEVQDW